VRWQSAAPTPLSIPGEKKNRPPTFAPSSVERSRIRLVFVAAEGTRRITPSHRVVVAQWGELNLVNQ